MKVIIYIINAVFLCLHMIILFQGGETNNLTEATILNLFVNSSERKPSQNFPIKVLQDKRTSEKLRGSGLNKVTRFTIYIRPLKRFCTFIF